MKIVLQLTCEDDGPFEGAVIMRNNTPYHCGLAFQTVKNDLPKVGINLNLVVEDGQRPALDTTPAVLMMNVRGGKAACCGHPICDHALPDDQGHRDKQGFLDREGSCSVLGCACRAIVDVGAEPEIVNPPIVSTKIEASRPNDLGLVAIATRVFAVILTVFAVILTGAFIFIGAWLPAIAMLAIACVAGYCFVHS